MNHGWQSEATDGPRAAKRKESAKRKKSADRSGKDFPKCGNILLIRDSMVFQDLGMT